MPTIETVIYGIMPEALFFTLFIIISKDIREKRFLLFIGLFIDYYLCKVLCATSFWFYIIYTIALFMILKAIHKETDIIDIFLFSISSILLMLIGGLCYSIGTILNLDYWILYAINRITIFITLLVFRKIIRKFYLFYRKQWNRREDNKYKSISVRNVSLVALNVMMYILNLSAVYLSTL